MKHRVIPIILTALLLLTILSGTVPVAAASSLNLPAEDAQAVAAAVQTVREKLTLRENEISVEIHFSVVDESLLERVVFQIYEEAVAHNGEANQGDYIYYHISAVQMNCGGTKSDEGMDLTFTYTVQFHTDAQQEAAVDSAVDAVLKELNLWNATDYEKIRGIYDFICGHTTYDFDNLYDEAYLLKYSAYAALINKTSVCQGYATLFYRLALELGVDCRVIEGISGGGPHAWNIVELDGKYYYLDTTWDAGRDPYAYFLKGSSTLTDHAPDVKYNAPEFVSAYPISETDYQVPVSHDYQPVVTPPSCTQDGYTTYTCSHCGDSYTADPVSATGHDYGKKVTAPSCTQDGYTTYTCKTCGDSYRADIVTASGHAYTDTVIPPSCDAQGYTSHVCACGESYTDSFVDPVGHQYGTDHVCGFCGQLDPDHKEPEPSEPEPSEPEPSEPEPSEPEPSEPEPSEPEPSEPEPSEPEPSEPEPSEPEPSEPEPSEPEPSEPEPSQPKPTDSEPTEPKPSDPKPADPQQPDEPSDRPNGVVLPALIGGLLLVVIVVVVILTRKKK